MVDRVTAYPGQVPRVEDFLQAQKNVVYGTGRLIEAVVGNNAAASGFAASIDSSANFTVGIGSVSAQSVMDQVGYGILGTDATPLTKQGILNAPVTLALASYAPGTSGQSVNVLIQVEISETDGSNVVLPYYNTSSPTTPYNGAMGAGAAQPTVRACAAIVSAVAGTAATTGSQTTPAVSAYNVALYVVTLTYGAAATFVQHPAAPFIPWTLPQLAPGFSRYAEFTSAGTFSFTVPAGVQRFKVRMCGGGGGGGAGATNMGGGGGGAAGYTEGVITVAYPGQVFSLTVGAAGAGGTTGAPGTNGGNSYIGSMAATGGGYGPNAATFAPGGDPGSGSGGSVNMQGGFGGDGNWNTLFFPGNGGASVFGGGGRAAPTGGSVEQNARAPGSGGGGCYSQAGSGGSGAPGIIIIEY